MLQIAISTECAAARNWFPPYRHFLINCLIKIKNAIRINLLFSDVSNTNNKNIPKTCGVGQKEAVQRRLLAVIRHNLTWQFNRLFKRFQRITKFELQNRIFWVNVLVSQIVRSIWGNVRPHCFEMRNNTSVMFIYSLKLSSWCYLYLDFKLI